MIFLESADLFRSRQNTQGVEIGASHEHGIGANRGRQDSQGSQFGEDIMVDVIRFGNFAPLEARPCGDKGKLHGGVPIEVADEYRGFDWALAGAAGYRIGNSSFGSTIDGGVGRLGNSQARSGARGAVGE